MYVTFIPPSGKEVIKLRISDHQSTQDEWGRNELTGLPNRRYSIVLFSKKSMPTESKQGIKELKWKSYMAQKIPVYEKAFNRYYLHETFNTLKTILLSIYQGGCPEDRSIPINLNENKQYKYNRNNIKKKLIRLTEADLHRIVNRSVRNVLNEYADWKYDFAGYDLGGEGPSYPDPELSREAKKEAGKHKKRLKTDRDYAMKYGWDEEPKGYVHSYLDTFIPHENKNVYDTQKYYNPRLDAKYYNEYWYRNGYDDYVKDLKAFYDADHKPLHRKGSLNREI